MALRVVDLFCGAGGFSEGFRQAGFLVIAGFDNWPIALDTQRGNHRGTTVLGQDVERLSQLQDAEFHSIIPDSEVIIGSPPCMAFSNSNKSGKGDKAEGIRLIEAFLRIVARKKWQEDSILKYWILENVPNSRKYIQSSYAAHELGLSAPKALAVKHASSGLYNALSYGAPSRRIRYFCGNFPQPVRDGDAAHVVLTLGDVLASLGPPTAKEEGIITDPVYGFEMNGSDVTDHHYIQKLARYQWKKVKRLKEDRGYMGRMSFPENLSNPARTVIATMSFTARESMVFPNGRGSYRAPTIRELATLMSFPIDYRFYGENLRQKHTLVGNAVPPRMALALARSIAEKEGEAVPKRHKRLNHYVEEGFTDFNGQIIPVPREKPKHPKSRFKYHIPYLNVDDYRVELTNYQSVFESQSFSWNVEIHRGRGPDASVFSPNPTKRWFSPKTRKAIGRFTHEVKPRLVAFNEFQDIYCRTHYQRKRAGAIGPDELLVMVREFIDSLGPGKSGDGLISIGEAPQSLPSPIAAGYVVLAEFVNEMRNLSGEG